MVYRACKRTCRGRLGPDRQLGSLGFAAKHSMAVSLPCWGRLEQAGQLAARNPMELRRRSSPPDAASEVPKLCELPVQICAATQAGPRVRIRLPPPASPRTLGPSRDEIRPGRQAAAQHSSKAEPDQADSLACHILPRRWCGCEKSAAFVSVLDGDGHWVEYNDPVFGERMPEATAGGPVRRESHDGRDDAP